jgi:glycerol kinase
MPTPYILAIDQGTTSSRAIVFDGQGNQIAMAQKELRQIFAHPGWVEQDAMEIWRDTLDVCREALARGAGKAAHVTAIGIANQRETTILWDRQSGRPVANAIVWQDRRTADYCAGLKKEGLEDAVRAKTGLLIDPYFSATKIGWLLDNIDGLRTRAQNGEIAFGTVDCWLLYKLTGGKVHATDVTNASRTLLYDITAQDWDDDLLEIFGIPRALLPRVEDNSYRFGDTDPQLFGTAIPIAGMAGDQQAALVGQACFDGGMIKSTYGTGCFALLNIGAQFRQSRHRLLTTIGYRIDNKITYALEGSIFIAGAAVQWLRDELGIIDHAHETEALAGSVADNGGAYMVPAFAGLGAPHWDPDARGALIGLTRGTSRAHIVRAALESQAYQTHDLMAAMHSDSGRDPIALRIDGGMADNNWVCQFLADITRLPVDRPVVTQTTALGAAYLAGLQTGVFSSPADISAKWRLDKRFAPRMGDAERARLCEGWSDAVQRVLSTGR